MLWSLQGPYALSIQHKDLSIKVCLCLSNEADADDFILWLVGFFHKVCLGKRFFFAISIYLLNLSQQDI